ncbi:co-chaperone GroES [Candidatus Dependentiae bacterium]|nr:co-chaperone GroES [Candidatus Dependentiae bacterium]
MFEKFRPLGDRVLVKRVEHQDTTQGGIIIPDAAKEKTQTAEVIAVGPGARGKDGQRMPMTVKIGDTIYFGKFSGTDAGDEHLIIREDDILGVLDR